MATGPDLHIADADREAAAAHLREHYAQGRLTLAEFNTRLDAVFAATTQSQLTALTRDLPHTAASSPPLPFTTTGTGTGGGSGQERARGGRQRGSWASLGMIPVLIAALAAWLLIFDLHMRVFAWPGRLAIFLAVFGAVRWLMRRWIRKG